MDIMAEFLSKEEIDKLLDVCDDCEVTYDTKLTVVLDGVTQDELKTLVLDILQKHKCTVEIG